MLFPLYLSTSPLSDMQGPAYPVIENITTLTKVVRSLKGGGPEFADWQANHQGILTNNVADMLAWERVPDDQLQAIGAGDLSSCTSDVFTRFTL